MDISDGIYLGISMPRGDEIDAIGMALIKKIICNGCGSRV